MLDGQPSEHGEADFFCHEVTLGKFVVVVL